MSTDDEVLAALDFTYPNVKMPPEEQANWDALREYYADDPEMLAKMDLSLVRAVEVIRAVREDRDPREAWSE
jgi:hypothetical protein